MMKNVTERLINGFLFGMSVLLAGCGAENPNLSQLSDDTSAVMLCQAPVQAVDLSRLVPVMDQGQRVYVTPEVAAKFFSKQTNTTSRSELRSVRSTEPKKGGIVNSSLQAIAQARANALARSGRLSHSISNAPRIPSGVYEGIGYASGGQPSTCRWNSAVLADAIARGANGLLYRVRFFAPGGRRISSGR